jgi:hypothetical protein
VPTSFAAGVFVAVGVLTAVAACGLLKFSGERINAVAIVLAVVVLLGSLAILAAGVACMRASAGTADVTPVDPGAMLIGLAGVSLAFAALFLNYDGFSTLWSEVGERTSAEFFFEPAVAVIVMIVGLVVLGSRPKFASGLLLAVGAATAFHFLGVIFAAWRAVGEVGSIGEAGFIGLLGGLLVALDGAYVYRSSVRAQAPDASDG